MWWFLNNLKQNQSIDFYQVFIESNQVYTDDIDDTNNVIYSFVEDTEKKIKFNLDLMNLINCKTYDITNEIKIISNVISYKILKENTNYVFTMGTKFIAPPDNIFNVPIFLHTYKQVNSKRFPNLIESKYDENYMLNCKIYDLDNNIQFVIETNTITNVVRKYFIVENLDLLKKYFVGESK